MSGCELLTVIENNNRQLTCRVGGGTPDESFQVRRHDISSQMHNNCKITYVRNTECALSKSDNIWLDNEYYKAMSLFTVWAVIDNNKSRITRRVGGGIPDESFQVRRHDTTIARCLIIVKLPMCAIKSALCPTLAIFKQSIRIMRSCLYSQY